MRARAKVFRGYQDKRAAAHFEGRWQRIPATTANAFVDVDPAILDEVDAVELKEVVPSTEDFDFDPMEFLPYLPRLEAEIFHLIREVGMSQNQIKGLLGLSQPTISYRYRRAIEKISYLATLANVDVREELAKLEFLESRERDILADLFFWVNQDAVGRQYDVSQSSVKWIALKTRRRLEALSTEDPVRWFNLLGLVYLLFRNLGIRVRS
jgi:DNA-directed RNA polymerase specialized sigma subunit